MIVNDRTFLEPRFGHDFSQVRVHTDTLAAETVRAVNVRAFTINQESRFDIRKKYQFQFGLIN